MSELIQHDEQLSTTEERGRKLYKSNPHYRNIATVMEHPEFRNFYETYMNDWFVAKTALMFLKVYEAIEDHANAELTPYQKIAIMHEILSNGDLRRKTVECMQDWSSDNLLTGSPSNDMIRKCICSSIDSKY